MKLNSNYNYNSKSNSNYDYHITDQLNQSQRIYRLRHPTQKVKEALNVDYVWDLNCYGDNDDTEATCDATNIARTYQRDGILGLIFWKPASANTYNQVLDVKQVVFDDSMLSCFDDIGVIHHVNVDQKENAANKEC